jgi:NAD(P)-dependent dehydrogenase (short-subunit alcohol dehydrogenase family)
MEAVTYNSSKHAVAGITKSAGLDYAKHGIHVNAPRSYV